MSAELVIQAKDLTRSFGSFTAVDRITFDVRAGEVFGFLGANGAGQDDGDPHAHRPPRADGRPRDGGRPRRRDRHADAIKHSIGYMSQRFSLYEDLTVAENIRLYGGIYNLSPREIRDRAEAMLARLGPRARGDDARAIDSARLAPEAGVLGGAAARARGSSFSMSRPAAWTRSRAASSGSSSTRRPRRHDRAGDDALHGRGGVLRADLHHGGRPHRRHGHARRAQGRVRRARPSTNCSFGWRAPAAADRRRCRSARSERASGPAPEGAVPHCARSPDARRHRADADRAGRAVRLRDQHRRQARPARHRRSRRRTTRRWRSASASRRRRTRSSVAAVVPRHRALESLFQRGTAQAAVVFEPGFATPDLGQGLPAPAAARRSMRPSRTPEARSRATCTAVVAAFERERGATAVRTVQIVPAVQMALQPDAREQAPLRSGADGLRADDRLGADDGDLADAGEGDRHDRGAARVAAPPLADRGRQGRCRIWGSGSSACSRWCVEARLVFDVPGPGQRGAPARRGPAVHPGVAVARHPDFGAHLVAARGHDGRAHRHHAADDAAVGVHVSDRQHAARRCRSRRTSCRPAGSWRSRGASCSRASASSSCGRRRWSWPEWRCSC